MEFEEVMDHIEKADVNSNGCLTREELKKYFESLDQNSDFIEVSLTDHFSILVYAFVILAE